MRNASVSIFPLIFGKSKRHCCVLSPDPQYSFVRICLLLSKETLLSFIAISFMDSKMFACICGERWHWFSFQSIWKLQTITRIHTHTHTKTLSGLRFICTAFCASRIKQCERSINMTKYICKHVSSAFVAWMRMDNDIESPPVQSKSRTNAGKVAQRNGIFFSGSFVLGCDIDGRSCNAPLKLILILFNSFSKINFNLRHAWRAAFKSKRFLLIKLN